MAATDPDKGAGTSRGRGRDKGTGAGADTDRPGRIEAHGIDHVPDGERHGRARELFAVWAAANVNYLSMVVGGALVLMGLSLWQAVAVIVAGSLFWAPIGLLAVSGPASGTPSEVVARAMYGIRGNRVNIAVNGWLLCICYIALNLAAAAVAAFVLVEKAGIETTSGVKVAVVVVIAAVTLAIGVYGHATMVTLYPPIAIALTVTFAFVAAYVCTRADLGHQPGEPLTGIALWAALAAGVTLIASGPLSYANSADFSRYLPRTTSPWAVAGWTALGGFLPGVLLSTLGALAATVVDMTEPQAGLEGILPSWFSPVFLSAIVLGTIANNAMTAYSSGLALQAAGVRVGRSLGVLVDGALGVGVTLYALLVSNFLDTVGNLLQLTVVVLGPGTAVYATDILLRRCRYDGPALTDETPGSPFWYTGGVNRSGALALTAGIAASALCVDTLYTGPVARALGGVDLSLPAGIIVSAALYGLLMRRSLRGPAAVPPA
ncbi:purine-cytosine permease family protein [Streptomyces sp. NPDC051563]|uniref:purine-cytosine permease family protein n=1 Tax=Streptomyces sp. NPDC051563 TaxID=3365659 RepID=UPI00379ADBA1